MSPSMTWALPVPSFTGVVTWRSSMSSVCTSERCTASHFPSLRSPTPRASWWMRTPSWWRLSPLSKHLHRTWSRAAIPSSTLRAPLELDRSWTGLDMIKSWVSEDQHHPTHPLCLSVSFFSGEGKALHGLLTSLSPQRQPCWGVEDALSDN